MSTLLQLGPAPSHTATRNACKLCTPLGASLAFSGVEGCVPLLHGSQGCSTYIRRYMISHYREPIDIASSNFAEQTAVFGGRDNLFAAIRNVCKAYSPKAVGIATTCLAETIGDDVAMYLHEFRKTLAEGDAGPRLIHVSTPSDQGTHAEGFTRTLRALVDTLAEGGERMGDVVNIIPAMLSPADLRHLRELVEAFGLRPIVMPDYADRLDGPAWPEYHVLPPGGTTVEEIARMGRAAATIEFATTAPEGTTAGALLQERFGVPLYRMAIPCGVVATDAMTAVLEAVSGRALPERIAHERGRLVDSFIDAHKYAFEQRAIVYGEEDLVIALCSMLSEVGVLPVLAASGGRSKRFAPQLFAACPTLEGRCEVMEDIDFETLTEHAKALRPDVLVGHSKGYKLARELGVPLVRVGFPVHDRMGGARLLHVGYRGTQQLFDRVVNALLEEKQDESDIGFTYL